MTRAWYRPVDPPEDLARVLACSWTAVPSGIHRLTPDGRFVAEWFPTFPDMADPYKTDAPLAVSMAS